MSKVPYERVVQWAAGPVAIVAGYLATQLTTHVALFGGLGLGHDAVAHAIVGSVTFISAAAVTYAAHHKWLTNVAKWWDSKQVQGLATLAAPLSGGMLIKGQAGTFEPNPDAVLAEIDKVDGALAKLLADPGTPADAVTAGLAPDTGAPVPPGALASAPPTPPVVNTPQTPVPPIA